jgi:RimJ/RimL family protein N-acetyltransferase
VQQCGLLNTLKCSSVVELLYFTQETITTMNPASNPQFGDDMFQEKLCTFEVNDIVYSLSPMCDHDKPALLEHLNVSDEISKCALRVPYPYTEQDAEVFLGRVKAGRESYGQPTSFAIREPQEGRLIGAVGFADISATFQPHKGQIGYWLAKAYWGRGIMTAALRAFVDAIMPKYNLVRLEAITFDFNTSSQNVLRKCGFSHEGSMKAAYWKNGKYLDAERFALVRFPPTEQS